MSQDLSSEFEKFANRKVNIHYFHREWPVGKSGGKLFYEFKWLNRKDPALVELREAAKEKGLQLRVAFAGALPPLLPNSKRVSATITQGSDGTFRIGRTFKRG